MYEQKKNGKVFWRISFWDRTLVFWKKNLPNRGLTKVEKLLYTTSLTPLSYSTANVTNFRYELLTVFSFKSLSVTPPTRHPRFLKRTL